jgi:hypothetical protein
LAVALLLKKSISEFAVTLCFRGLAVTARMVLGLLTKEMSEVASVKFLKGMEGVEIGFVEEEGLQKAMRKGLKVGEVMVPMSRCLRWDPRVVQLLVRNVPTASEEETKRRITEVMEKYGEVVDISFQLWEGTVFRTGDVDVRLQLAGKETTNQGSDWPRVVKWGPTPCTVERMRGTVEEEEDLLEALEGQQGAIDLRAQKWEKFLASTRVEVVNGKRMQVDKEVWERMQGRL